MAGDPKHQPAFNADGSQAEPAREPAPPCAGDAGPGATAGPGRDGTLPAQDGSRPAAAASPPRAPSAAVGDAGKPAGGGRVTRRREFRPQQEYLYDRRSPARWVASHTLRYPLLALLMVAASVVNNTAYGNISVYVGKSFDRIITPGWQTPELLGLVLVIVGLAVVQGVTGLARNYSVEFLAQRIERDAREEYYASLLEKDQTFHGRQRVGDLMARATYDVHNLNMMFSPGIMLIIDSILTYGVPMVLIGLIHPRLLLTPALLSVGLFFTVRDYNRRLKPVSLAQQDQYGKVSADLEEAVAGIVAVKSNTQERYELAKFMGDARVFRDYYVKQGIIQARYWPLLVYAFFWGAALFHGLSLWHQGVVTIGQVVAFLGLFNAFRFVTFISIFSFNLVQHGMASAERILSVIATTTELDQNLQGVSRPIAGRVEFQGVSFGYDGADTLRGISLRVEPGQTAAIVGQTGSGKTTLTRLINRIYDPTEGRVLIDGTDVRCWNLESLRSQIAVIEQDVFLFSRTIRENIAFGRPDVTRRQIEEAARQAQAHEFIVSFPDGYDTVIGERGVTLSGGQKQRIAIARAFLIDPRILILDDSTSAIDSRTEDEIQKAMRRISRDRTTFLITHRLSLIRRAEPIIVLKGGRIIDQGRHEELLARCADYRRIFVRS